MTADKPEAAVMCRQCSVAAVEPERTTWATPVCFACLPPPRPLPIKHTDGCARRMAILGSCSCIDRREQGK